MFAIKSADKTILDNRQNTIQMPAQATWVVLNIAVSDMTSLLLKHREENGVRDIELEGIGNAIQIMQTFFNSLKENQNCFTSPNELTEIENKLYDLNMIFEEIKSDVFSSM